MKQISLLFTLILIFGCSGSKRTSEEIIDPGSCKELYKNNFSTTKVEKESINFNRKTIFVNEIRFECVQSIFSTNKAMFENYSKWDVVLKNPDQMHPTLVWNKVDLFGNGKYYRVFTKGRFSDFRFASVIVLDLNGNDLLADDSVEKEKLISLFADLIRSNSSENKEFIKHYWNAVDSHKWRL